MSSTKEFKAPVTKRKQKEEEDFPRGGASGLTPLEYKEIAHQADSSLFSVGDHYCKVPLSPSHMLLELTPMPILLGTWQDRHSRGWRTSQEEAQAHQEARQQCHQL